METKENGDTHEALTAPASPIIVLQKLSEEAVRRAGEAFHSAYSGNPILYTPPTLDPVPRHRRTRSEVVNSFHRRSNSTSNFQKWKCQMQRALHWGNHSFRDASEFSNFDPEILANQKRQWYQLHSKTLDHEKYKEPSSLFEHFVIAGLRPDANLEVVEDALVRRKKWEQEMARTEMLDFKMLQYRRPTVSTMEPKVLFKYPPGKKLALRIKDLAAFCFPGGVKAQILEKTPSLSELNELVYGQEHLSKDDLSFIFSLKVADNATLYGVCLHVQEFVQKPHAIYGVSSPLSQSLSGCSRFLVSAPRCYCILTRVPFFELHYETLNSIIAQERLNRITQFVTEMSLSDYVPSPSMSKDHMNGNPESPGEESVTDWMASAIPVNSAMALTAAAAGIISDEEVPSSSSARSMTSEEEEDETFFDQNEDPRDDMIMEWARILALVTGVLLEKQVVVQCPNLGVLSALVLSLIPIIRPFEWQSLFLPILPAKMHDFLDAPVPFIVGIQHKIADLKMKTSNLVRVNVVKDQVKTGNLPSLPQLKVLISELGPIHSTLSHENSISQRHPVYKSNEVQAESATQFLLVMRRYLESLCSDLRSHTITSVQSNDDRVSILLKDSFIDSFPVRDQSFIKLFVETQLFTVLSDSCLSSYENEYQH